MQNSDLALAIVIVGSVLVVCILLGLCVADHVYHRREQREWQRRIQRRHARTLALQQRNLDQQTQDIIRTHTNRDSHPAPSFLEPDMASQIRDYSAVDVPAGQRPKIRSLDARSSSAMGRVIAILFLTGLFCVAVGLVQYFNADVLNIGKGSSGSSGPAGVAISIPGTPGADGANGADGAVGAVGAQGVRGSDGAPGRNGTNGAQGANGVPGSPGRNGTDAGFTFNMTEFQGFLVSSGFTAISEDYEHVTSMNATIDPTVEVFSAATFKLSRMGTKVTWAALFDNITSASIMSQQDCVVTTNPIPLQFRPPAHAPRRITTFLLELLEGGGTVDQTLTGSAVVQTDGTMQICYLDFQGTSIASTTGLQGWYAGYTAGIFGFSIDWELDEIPPGAIGGFVTRSPAPEVNVTDVITELQAAGFTSNGPATPVNITDVISQLKAAGFTNDHEEYSYTTSMNGTTTHTEMAPSVTYSLSRFGKHMKWESSMNVTSNAPAGQAAQCMEPVVPLPERFRPQDRMFRPLATFDGQIISGSGVVAYYMGAVLIRTDGTARFCRVVNAGNDIETDGTGFITDFYAPHEQTGLLAFSVEWLLA